MKKGLIFGLILMLFAAFTSCADSKEAKAPSDIKISGKLFSVYLPAEVKGTFFAKKKNNGIFIYHKDSKKAGFGGFAFGVKAYRKPSEHANMPGGEKIGELTDKHGHLNDMVLIRPTDVQYDYTKGQSEAYNTLYDLAENVNISGTGKNVYSKNQGMKGVDLYKDVLKKHVIAIQQKWDSTKLEKENMSYMYNVLSINNKDNMLNKIGYIYYDVNGDGIEELFIGEIADGEWKGVIYDMYTMVNRKPVHVVSGGNRDRYFVCDDHFVCEEPSGGASESYWLVYFLTENSTELFPQVGFKYEEPNNKTKQWFISYNFEKNKWEKVTEKTFNERKSTFDTYKRFDYIPLNKI